MNKITIDLEDIEDILYVLDSINNISKRTTTGNLSHSIANIQNLSANWSQILKEKYFKEK